MTAGVAVGVSVGTGVGLGVLVGVAVKAAGTTPPSCAFAFSTRMAGLTTMKNARTAMLTINRVLRESGFNFVSVFIKYFPMPNSATMKFLG